MPRERLSAKARDTTWSPRRNTEVCLTRRWREMDSNHRSAVTCELCWRGLSLLPARERERFSLALSAPRTTPSSRAGVRFEQVVACCAARRLPPSGGTTHIYLLLVVLSPCSLSGGLAFHRVPSDELVPDLLVVHKTLLDGGPLDQRIHRVAHKLGTDDINHTDIAGVRIWAVGVERTSVIPVFELVEQVAHANHHAALDEAHLPAIP